MPEDIPLFDIRHAVTAQEMQLLGTLFQEYAADLSIDLGFQDFEQEIATLPGEYAPHAGPCCWLGSMAARQAAALCGPWMRRTIPTPQK